MGQQQENFELASQIWRELFSDQDDIRLLPNKIFRQLRDHCTIKLKESAGVQRRMQEYRDQVSARGKPARGKLGGREWSTHCIPFGLWQSCL